MFKIEKTDPLRFFSYHHLPQYLQPVGEAFFQTARWMVDELPPSAERSAGLRKLIEARDCAIRATVDAKYDGKLPPTDSTLRSVSL